MKQEITEQSENNNQPITAMGQTEIKNAIIESAEISINSYGVLDCWLHLNYGNSCQGFGGWVLYLPDTLNQGLSVAGHHVFRIMEIADVKNWSDLQGKTIRAESNWEEVIGIGHIEKNDWYYPGRDFESLLREQPTIDKPL